MEWLDKVDSFVWGWTMIALLVGTGLYLTARLLFVQVRHLGHAIACVFGKYDDPDEEGDVSHFKALATALSATIGTGNIAGVATAIAAGGPGAVFWMWITALVGMATKFTSCTLAVKYRVIHEDGSVSGGPMYFLKEGLKNKKLGAFLGGLFAFFGVVASFGIGNMVQANSVVGIGLMFFAYSTMIAWSYYGDRCAEYLFGPKAVPIYRWSFVAAITIGAVGGLRVIWTLADISNALMAIPNLIGLILLSGVVANETRKYMAKLKSGQFKNQPGDRS